jgi:hypothetical protein
MNIIDDHALVRSALQLMLWRRTSDARSSIRTDARGRAFSCRIVRKPLRAQARRNVVAAQIIERAADFAADRATFLKLMLHAGAGRSWSTGSTRTRPSLRSPPYFSSIPRVNTSPHGDKMTLTHVPAGGRGFYYTRLAHRCEECDADRCLGSRTRA